MALSFSRTVSFLALIAVLVSCGPGGIAPSVFNSEPPSGNLQVFLGGTGSPITSSLSAPIAVSGGFSLSVQEAHYTSTFTAQIVSWTAATTGPCYATTAAPATVFTFTPVAAAALSGAVNSPCGGADIEGVRFTDARGNATTAYYATGSGAGAGSVTPSGIVVATLPGTTTPLASSLSAPLAVTNSFSLAAQETGYTGTFTATITSYTAPTTAPCYVVSGGNSIVQPNIFTFTPQNPASINGTTGACSLGGDVESVRIVDAKGNATIQYYEATAGPGTAAVTVNRIALSFIGPVPAAGVCGTYQLKVQAYDPTGAAITTAVIYSYPITVSIVGAGNTALVTTSLSGLQPVCAIPPTASSTLSITASSSPVYVFVNGFQATGGTTLTATAFGVPAGNIGQLTF